MPNIQDFLLEKPPIQNGSITLKLTGKAADNAVRAMKEKIVSNKLEALVEAKIVEGKATINLKPNEELTSEQIYQQLRAVMMQRKKVVKSDFSKILPETAPLNGQFTLQLTGNDVQLAKKMKEKIARDTNLGSLVSFSIERNKAIFTLLKDKSQKGYNEVRELLISRKKQSKKSVEVEAAVFSPTERSSLFALADIAEIVSPEPHKRRATFFQTQDGLYETIHQEESKKYSKQG